jgi:hypothetical protein
MGCASKKLLTEKWKDGQKFVGKSWFGSRLCFSGVGRGGQHLIWCVSSLGSRKNYLWREKI